MFPQQPPRHVKHGKRERVIAFASLLPHPKHLRAEEWHEFVGPWGVGIYPGDDGSVKDKWVGVKAEYALTYAVWAHFCCTGLDMLGRDPGEDLAAYVPGPQHFPCVMTNPDFEQGHGSRWPCKSQGFGSVNAMYNHVRSNRKSKP